MTPSSNHDDRPGAPTIAEVAALTRRLRALSTPGRDADPAERAAFLADKDALIARITDTANATAEARGWDRSRAGFAASEAMRAALTDAVLARAAGDGYVLVGPSARTWRRDPDTGRPTVEVPDAEHQAVRDLLGRYALDTTEPEWVVGPDGHDDIHTTVHIADTTDDTDDDLEDDPWTVPDEARAFDEAAGDELDREFEELTDRHPLPGDPGGDEPVLGPSGSIYWAQPGGIDDGSDAATDDGARLAMPDWMREQAAATDAETAARTAPGGRRDDPPELAARVAALRGQITADAAAGSGPPAPYCELVDAEHEDQLARWHTDDTEQDRDGRDAAGEGLTVLDDGPGLP